MIVNKEHNLKEDDTGMESSSLVIGNAVGIGERYDHSEMFSLPTYLPLGCSVPLEQRDLCACISLPQSSRYT